MPAGSRSTEANLVLVRATSLAIGFGGSLLTARLIIATYGAPTFGAITLISGMATLLPFSDLGLGSVVVNVTSDRGDGQVTRDAADATLTRCFKLLLIAGGVVGAAAALISVLNGWGRIVGNEALESLASPIGILIALILVAAAIPFGTGARVLQGSGGTFQMAIIQALVAPASAVLTVCLILASVPAWVLAPVPAFAGLALAISATWYARRRISFQWTTPTPDTPESRALVRIGLPAAVVSLGLAISFQLDRLVIAHRGSLSDVAVYSLVFPILSGMISIAALMGQRLWPEYRSALQSGSLTRERWMSDLRSFARWAALLGGGCVAAGTAYVGIVAPRLWGDARAPLLFAGCLIALQTVHQPSAMVLTDSRGFAWQARVLAGCSAVNVALAVVVTPYMGASGPLLSSIVAVGAIQLPLTIRQALRVMER